MAYPVQLGHMPGRGRGLITTRDVAAGEIVIAEEPLLLTVSQEFKDQVCTNCLCWLEHCPGAVRCQECHQAAFCSAVCQQQAAGRQWVHAAATCRAYAQLPLLFPGDVEQQNYLRFLIQAAAIKAAAAAAAAGDARQQQCAAAYEVLLGLVGDATAATSAAAAMLHPALCQAIGDPSGQLLSAAEVAALLSKEHLNAFGLLAPLHLQRQHQNVSAAAAAAAAAAADGEDEGGRTSRKLRGGALYPTCALLNHECVPSVARFDALDAAVGGAWPAQWPGRGQPQQQQAAAVAAVVSSNAAAAAAVAAAAGLSAGPHGSSCGCGSNGSSSGGCGGSSTTLVTMRALHALPAGSEVVLSYVPLDWDLQDRQAQMQQLYGFSCSCPRCLLESSPEWQAGQDDSDGDWETDSGGEDGDSSSSSGAREDVQGQQGDTSTRGPSVAEGEGPQGMEEDTQHHAEPQKQQQQQEALEPGYLSVFLLKYLCPNEGCGGTMAPVHGSSSSSGGEVCECSVCGALSTEAQFLAELQQ